MEQLEELLSMVFPTFITFSSILLSLYDIISNTLIITIDFKLNGMMCYFMKSYGYSDYSYHSKV